MTSKRRTKKQVLDLSDTLDNDFQIDSKIPKEDTIHQASDEPARERKTGYRISIQ